MTFNGKTALGRGLSALLERTDQGERPLDKPYYNLNLEKLEPGRFQPRTYFNPEELESLADSIRERGVLQPILIRVHPSKAGMYEIVAGERRWRAAKLAGLTAVPVIVKELTDYQALEVGLLENVQRQDLNAIEEAEGYRRLTQEFQYTQDTIAKTLGKSRSHIANCLRLLSLPPEIQKQIAEGKLSPGHARALMGADDTEALAKQVVDKKLSVRETEKLTKRRVTSRQSLPKSDVSDPEAGVLGDHLSDLLGVEVELVLKASGDGVILVPFKNPDELDQLMQKFNQL